MTGLQNSSMYVLVCITRNTILKYSIRDNNPHPGIDYVCLAEQYLVIYWLLPNLPGKSDNS